MARFKSRINLRNVASQTRQHFSAGWHDSTVLRAFRFSRLRVPRRVFAPQRAAFEKSPGVFPLLSQRAACHGVTVRIGSLNPSLVGPSGTHGPHDRLSAFMNVDVLDGDFLIERLMLRNEDAG